MMKYLPETQNDHAFKITLLSSCCLYWSSARKYVVLFFLVEEIMNCSENKIEYKKEKNQVRFHEFMEVFLFF